MENTSAESLNHFVTVKTYSSMFKISVSTIYSLIRSEPDFPAMNLGLKKKYYINLNKIDSWMYQRSKALKSEKLNIPSIKELMEV